jgi:hypothetical protein
LLKIKFEEFFFLARYFEFFAFETECGICSEHLLMECHELAPFVKVATILMYTVFQ